ncbi:MAG TPA: bifunctional alpha,alpha-trehalose-phosphate synthase (UDP-forming)/trehalose-phosphatase, partial [Enhygromyxa sp.]|nr:bifunctional alpha,alpha-trehalose-phosphate synthase (UDP-forming)/trehalose-phosphatase [Enhygromyxa sp.]
MSNRLPVVLERDDAGALQAQPGAGGLVSAMQPVLARRGGAWIGWLGSSDLGDVGPLLERVERQLGFRLRGVELSGEEIINY